MSDIVQSLKDRIDSAPRYHLYWVELVTPRDGDICSDHIYVMANSVKQICDWFGENEIRSVEILGSVMDVRENNNL